jgi:hypothetical protein
MRKYLGYIVLSVASAIYILYNFSVTSAFIYMNPSEDLHVARTFLAEVLAFLPIVILFIGMLQLAKNERDLFEQFDLRSFTVHLGIFMLFVACHASWQVFVNSQFLNSVFSTDYVLKDALYFINMRVIIYVIMGGLVVGINKIQERVNYELKESELRLSLQKEKLRQIEFKLNPEIIYPVLNYVKKHAVEEPEKSSTLVLNLSQQLRLLIDNLDEERLPVDKDLRFYRSYFENVCTRLEKGFQIIDQVRDEYLNVKIPPSILLVPFFEELFFGRYARFFETVERVTYRSKESTEDHIYLCLEFYPVKNSEFFNHRMRDDGKLEEIRNFLNHFNKSLFEASVADGTFSMQLNFHLLYELDEQPV